MWRGTDFYDRPWRGESGSHGVYLLRKPRGDLRWADGRGPREGRRRENIRRRIACDDNGQCPVVYGVPAWKWPAAALEDLTPLHSVMMRKRPITTLLRPAEHYTLIFLRVPARMIIMLMLAQSRDMSCSRAHICRRDGNWKREGSDKGITPLHLVRCSARVWLRRRKRSIVLVRLRCLVDPCDRYQH